MTSQYETKFLSTHVNIVRLAEPIRHCVRWRAQVFKIEGFVCKRFLPSFPSPPLSFCGSRFISRSVKTENPLPRSFFAPKPKGNACYERYLKVSSRIVNLIGSETGSQWISKSMRVMWSHFLERVISPAAAFCTDWSFSMTFLGTLYSRELQWSSLEVTNAWIWVSVVCVDKYDNIAVSNTSPIFLACEEGLETVVYYTQRISREALSCLNCLVLVCRRTSTYQCRTGIPQS